MIIADNWLPTSDNINALPKPVRDYICGLETNADPSGMVRDNTLLRDEMELFKSTLRDGVSR